jgi:hypothetical protein
MTCPPSIEKVVPPLPPPVQEFLPNPTPTKYEIQLNINVSSVFGKLNMTVHVMDMCKIPYMRREVLKLLNVPNQKKDPPIILNTMYIDQKRDSNSPFYISFDINGLHLKNCMLESGASTNVISLKVMEKLS